MRYINKHIVHCSDSNAGDVKNIRAWHKQRGFDDVGYHFIIRTDGEVEVGRMLNVIGAHCKGYNKTSVASCLIGKNIFTEKQFESLSKIHKMLEKLFPKIVMHAHNEFNVNKTCPNFNIKILDI